MQGYAGFTTRALNPPTAHFQKRERASPAVIAWLRCRAARFARGMGPDKVWQGRQGEWTLASAHMRSGGPHTYTPGCRAARLLSTFPSNCFNNKAWVPCRQTPGIVTMHAWPVAHSIFDAPLVREANERTIGWITGFVVGTRKGNVDMGRASTTGRQTDIIRSLDGRCVHLTRCLRARAKGSGQSKAMCVMSFSGLKVRKTKHIRH